MSLNSRNVFIIASSCLLAWIDLLLNVSQVSIGRQIHLDKLEVQTKYLYLTVYNVLASMPLALFSAFLVAHLSYRLVAALCSGTPPPGDTELIYSRYDIDYVLDLVRRPPKLGRRLLITNKKHDYFVLVEENNWIRRLVNQCRRLVDWNEHFRFSARFMSIVVVALVALYFMALYLSYSVMHWSSQLISKATPTLKIIILVINLSTNGGDMRFDRLEDVFAGHKSFIVAIFVTPLFVAWLICVVQLYLLAADTKTHIRQLYRGNCEFVVKAANISNSSIAKSSFQFAG